MNANLTRSFDLKLVCSIDIPDASYIVAVLGVTSIRPPCVLPIYMITSLSLFTFSDSNSNSIVRPNEGFPLSGT